MNCLRVSLAAALLALGCEPAPQPLIYGEDACTYCKMTAVDQTHGAELLTRKGKIYKFDSIECLAAYYLKGSIPESEVHSMWVTDFENTPTLISVHTAVFLRSPRLHSPMSLNLSAFWGEAAANAALEKYPGQLLDWTQVQTTVKEAWFSTDRSFSPSPIR